jgi:hypothetical protein
MFLIEHAASKTLLTIIYRQGLALGYLLICHQIKIAGINVQWDCGGYT